MGMNAEKLVLSLSLSMLAMVFVAAIILPHLPFWD
jgi:hypothetical protein